MPFLSSRRVVAEVDLTIIVRIIRAGPATALAPVGKCVWASRPIAGAQVMPQVFLANSISIVGCNSQRPARH